MLAPSFKAPAELRISESTFSALVTVLGMLERGEIAAKEFSMDFWWEPGRTKRGRFCGTVGCIGGWASYVARKAGHTGGIASVFDFGGHAVNELFHPSSKLAAWDATRAQAAQALRNYLTTGKADWQGVMDG